MFCVFFFFPTVARWSFAGVMFLISLLTTVILWVQFKVLPDSAFTRSVRQWIVLLCLSFGSFSLVYFELLVWPISLLWWFHLAAVIIALPPVLLNLVSVITRDGSAVALKLLRPFFVVKLAHAVGFLVFIIGYGVLQKIAEYLW